LIQQNNTVGEENAKLPKELTPMPMIEHQQEEKQQK
jgi:hypothetical protein